LQRSTDNSNELSLQSVVPLKKEISQKKDLLKQEQKFGRSQKSIAVEAYADIYH